MYSYGAFGACLKLIQSNCAQNWSSFTLSPIFPRRFCCLNLRKLRQAYEALCPFKVRMELASDATYLVFLRLDCAKVVVGSNLSMAQTTHCKQLVCRTLKGDSFGGHRCTSSKLTSGNSMHTNKTSLSNVPLWQHQSDFEIKNPLFTYLNSFISSNLSDSVLVLPTT